MPGRPAKSNAPGDPLDNVRDNVFSFPLPRRNSFPPQFRRLRRDDDDDPTDSPSSAASASSGGTIHKRRPASSGRGVGKGESGKRNLLPRLPVGGLGVQSTVAGERGKAVQQRGQLLCNSDMDGRAI